MNTLSKECPVGQEPPAHPSFAGALKVWMKIGLLSFGGPAGQIALMHQLLVEKLKWISDRRFLHALNFCMLLPGPEAQQTAIYTGWLLHGRKGGVAAGLLFVLPGALLMFAISYIYITYGGIPIIASIFYGLKAAVMAIVAAAVIRIGRKVLNNPACWFLAAASFASIFFFNIPFPFIIMTALLLGIFMGHYAPTALDTKVKAGDTSLDDGVHYVISDRNLIPPASVFSTLRTAAIWLFIWLFPLLICLRRLGGEHILSQEGMFFGRAALITFGGAYAVLPYVAQYAVEVREWLTPLQMMDGLGLAETTPGPLILVLQFVGFMGGWNNPMEMSPLAMATMASFITSWMTFVPGCLFIFTGAPAMEQSHGNKKLAAALTVVTAAVAGVVLNLAVWFALNVIAPEPGAIDWIPLAAAIALFIALQKFKWDVLKVVGAGALFGLTTTLFA